MEKKKKKKKKIWQFVLLLPPMLLKRKLLELDASQNQRFRAVGTLGSETSVSVTARQLGLPRQIVWFGWHIAARLLERFLTYPAAGVPQVSQNDPTAGSLQACHSPAEQISASCSQCWHHSQTENNKRWYCEFAWAKPTRRKTPCCSPSCPVLKLCHFQF